MTKISRRGVLQAAGLMTAGLVTGCATSAGNGRNGVAFSVAQASIPIAGSSEHFPVRRIYCIGRNYAAHAAELGNAVGEEPVVFMKPPTAIVPPSRPIRLPISLYARCLMSL